MGKGGVGKTTVAAAIAVGLVKRGHQVHQTTTDPAAHVAFVAEGHLDGLTVDRIDPATETARYVDKVMATRGRDLDEADRALMREDLASPCTEEVAVFHAFSRIVAEARSAFVVVDTAPTGHTLLLLDATGAYHRQMTQDIGAVQGRIVTPPHAPAGPPTTPASSSWPCPKPRLSPRPPACRTTCAGPGSKPWAWVVQRAMSRTGTTDPLLRRRIAAEAAQVARIRQGLARRLYLLPFPAPAARRHPAPSCPDLTPTRRRNNRTSASWPFPTSPPMPNCTTLTAPGWLRAAVLGANDGIVSVSSLIVGVAAADPSRTAILIAGAAVSRPGHVDGRRGIRVGQFAIRRGTRRRLARTSGPARHARRPRRRNLPRSTNPAASRPRTAALVARELTEKDALGAHVRDELGLSEVHAANPLQAAFASGLTFTVAAAVPVSPRRSPRTPDHPGRRDRNTSQPRRPRRPRRPCRARAKLRATLRVLFWGAAAMAITATVEPPLRRLGLDPGQKKAGTGLSRPRF